MSGKSGWHAELLGTNVLTIARDLVWPRPALAGRQWSEGEDDDRSPRFRPLATTATCVAPWWSFVLFVPSLVAAFITGEGLLAAMGHSGDQSPPAGTALMAALPAILVFALSTLLVWYSGHQAERHGHPEGRPSVIVAVVIAGGFLAMNLFQLVVGLIV